MWFLTDELHFEIRTTIFILLSDLHQTFDELLNMAYKNSRQRVRPFHLFCLILLCGRWSATSNLWIETFNMEPILQFFYCFIDVSTFLINLNRVLPSPEVQVQKMYRSNVEIHSLSATK